MDHDADPGGARKSVWDLFLDAMKIVLSIVIAAATVYGSPLSKELHDRWLTVALAAGLLTSLVVIYRRERKSGRVVTAEGVVRVLARRDQLTQTNILESMRAAKGIDMVGFNLRSPWLKSPSNFDHLIGERLKSESNLRIRIIIADPDAESLRRRDVQETGAETDRLPGEGNSVKNYLGDLRKRGKPGTVEVKFIDPNLIRCSLIIADERLFATWYLSFRGGSQSPTLEIAGSTTPLFAIFRKEFDTMWEWARPMDAP